MKKLLNAEDLADLFAELEKEEEMSPEPEQKDLEMTASERRYQEIIKKHKDVE